MKPGRYKKVNTAVKIREVIDGTTGEILETSTDSRNVFVDTEGDNFFMVFHRVMGALKGTTFVEEELVRFACLNCGMNTNIITFNKNRKSEAARIIGVKPQTIANAIHELKKKGVLISKGAGDYLINPEFFWRGALKEKKNAVFNLTVTKTGSDDKLAQ